MAQSGPQNQVEHLLILAGADKHRLAVDDLLGHFEELRRREMLDETAVTLLKEAYI